MVTYEVADEVPDQFHAPPPSLRTRLGAAVVVLSLMAVLLVHMPWLPLSWQAAGHALTNLVGLEHRWNMFSADPRASSIDMAVFIGYQDGSQGVWEIDRDIPGGEFRYYRWVRWMEAAVHQRPEEQLLGLASWIEGLAPAAVEKVAIVGYLQEPGNPGEMRPGPKPQLLMEVRGGLPVDSEAGDE